MIHSKKVNLLIVEDDPIIRTLLTQILTRAGHTVYSAEDGFSALAQIRETMPDIIVSDLNMPGMSGFELLSVVRRRLPSIYVIATSGAYLGDDVPHGIAADAFYEKASNLQTLLALTENAARSDERPVRSSRTAPIWVEPSLNESSECLQVSISCPECLRVFSRITTASHPLLNETTCAYCDVGFQYAIVRPLDPLTSQPFFEGPQQ